MIVVKLMGGLGNQMFQYATALALASRRKTNLLLDISSYSSPSDKDTPRKYELNVYPIRANLAKNDLLTGAIDSVSKRRRFFYLLKKTTRGGDGPLLVYREKTHGYNKGLRLVPDNSLLVGWWQCPKYFNFIREQLLHDFEPMLSPGANNSKLIKIARNSSSISIHVRRGDYISNNNAAVHHGTVSLDYYNDAINFIVHKIKKPVFFVFSDDIPWCKNNLVLPKNTVFVDNNSGDSAFEDIRIMKNCKHNIIANSSFSWWGAWLNENPNKIVIAPKVWFQNNKANDEIDIIPSEWIRL